MRCASVVRPSLSFVALRAMRLRAGAVLAAAVAATAVAGCGGGGGGGGGSSEFVTISISPATPFRFPVASEASFTGNNTILVTFNSPVDPSTVLDSGQPGGIGPGVKLVGYTGNRISTQGFVGGLDASGNPPVGGDPAIATDPPNVLRIVADSDGDLATPESFDSNQVTLTIFNSVRSMGGRFLPLVSCATYVVGSNTLNPPPLVLSTTPASNADQVALDQAISIEFNEEMDPLTLIGGDGQPRGIQLAGFNVPSGITLPSSFFPGRVMQASRGDFCRWIFVPDGPYPGNTVISFSVLGPAAGRLGVRDRIGAPISGSPTFSFTTGNGPTVANNPVVPNCIYFGAVNPSRFGVIGVNSITDAAGFPFLVVDTDGDNFPTVADDNLIARNSENTFMGRPLAIAVGDWITLGNSIDNPPFPNPPRPQPLASTATTVPSVCGIPPVLIPNSTNADIGNYVYVADADNNVVQVINSNTSLVVAAIPTPDPTGLAISPDLKSLYVTNFSAGTLSVVDINPRSARFNQITKTIQVGRGPRGVTAQPDGEDVLVVNSSENSLSVISTADLTVRKTVSSLLGPEAWDIASTYRYFGTVFQPGTGTYFAYITNRGGNSFSIFESGPTTPTLLGPDDVRAVITSGPLGPLSLPQGLQTDHFPINPGVFVTSPGNRSLVHMQITAFGPPPTPNFPNPAAGARTFEITQQVDPFDPMNPLGIEPVDVCLADNAFLCFQGTAQNHKNNLRFWPNFDMLGRRVRLYVANRGSGTVTVLDATTLLRMTEISVPGVSVLSAFYPH